MSMPSTPGELQGVRAPNPPSFPPILFCFTPQVRQSFGANEHGRCGVSLSQLTHDRVSIRELRGSSPSLMCVLPSSLVHEVLGLNIFPHPPLRSLPPVGFQWPISTENIVARSCPLFLCPQFQFSWSPRDFPSSAAAHLSSSEPAFLRRQAIIVGSLTLRFLVRSSCP